MPTTNGELIITKSHGPHHMSSGMSNAGPSGSSQSSPQSSGHHNLSNYHLPSSMNKSPTNSSSHKPPMSPAGSDNSGGDLLSDSPSKYMHKQFHLFFFLILYNEKKGETCYNLKITDKSQHHVYITLFSHLFKHTQTKKHSDANINNTKVLFYTA